MRLVDAPPAARDWKNAYTEEPVAPCAASLDGASEVTMVLPCLDCIYEMTEDDVRVTGARKTFGRTPRILIMASSKR